MKRPVGALIVLILGLLPAGGCFKSGPPPVTFSYSEILNRAYRFEGEGRVIPVTIEQSIEADGVFTGDGLYFFYASNRERGNFDIYLRSLSGITTVRITSHPSRDVSPAVSPDGRYLAFVSQREDPEGDIYVVKVDSASLLKKAASSVTGVPSLDGAAKNLTQMTDPVTKIIRVVKDDSPAWSPDGRRIAFSSNRDGKENIWIMGRDGKNLKKITARGGRSPRFSPDGRSILFISYRDGNSGGDIYMVDVDGGRERQITEGPAVELGPAFMGNANEILYALIDRDTSGDGKVDLKDRSVIYYRNLATGAAYPLTLRSASSFTPRWSPLFGGIVVYSNQAGQNININIIPATGIIPLKENAARQYDLAEKYLREFDDTERYLMCLERVYQFFGGRRDLESRVYSSKALADAAVRYRIAGDRAAIARVTGYLDKMASGKNSYAGVMGRYLKERFARGSGIASLGASLEWARKEKDTGIIPYLTEELGDELVRVGRKDEGMQRYREVVASYPSFMRRINVQYKIAEETGALSGAAVSPALIDVINSNHIYLKHDAVKSLLGALEKAYGAKRRLEIIDRLMVVHRNDKRLPGILQYAAGKAYYELGNNSASRSRLLEALKMVRRTDLVFYRSNTLLGAVAGRENNPPEMEKYLSAAVNNYSLYWQEQDVRKIAGRLIDYYEEYGERAEYAGNYTEAVDLYKKYVWMITYLHLKKRFEDLYNENAARAHVLYIDAYADMIGDDIAKLKVIEKEYDKRLNVARMDFDKAHLYGLGYLYSRMALVMEKAGPGVTEGGIKGLLKYFKSSVDQLDWALFIDDTFIDAYLLKGWIYQYVDQRRREDVKLTGGRKEGTIAAFFPRFLWESNIDLYEKALETNDEASDPEREGNLHLNIANTYFLLNNFPRALQHYEQVLRFKRTFSNRIEEALFHYHLGYCYWQNNSYERSRDEMNKALFIYRTLASGKNLRRYKHQIYYLYRFFALLARTEKNYPSAVEWYTRTMDFARSNRITIDRARYIQELASCYREMGNSDRALALLARSWRMLKNYDEKERKYRMRLRILGLGPVKFWDLGPDTAVIGDNRVFTELDAAQKRLLNLSLQEDIYSERGDYTGSVESLLDKYRLLSKPKTQMEREAACRTLNNIGYGYFRLGQYGNAGIYFQKAWDLAAQSGVNDLSGIFSSIINLTTLYATELESGRTGTTAGSKKINDLINKISVYRESYEKKRYAAELEKLREAAKATKQKLKPGEAERIRENIREEAAAVYYSLDVSLGILKFYNAEITAVNIRPAGRTADVDGAYSLYTDNRVLYGLYAEAKGLFESALIHADERASKRLKVKLLLNLGTCQARLGMTEDAYDSFTDAEKTAEAFGYEDLRWSVYTAIAGFLAESGAAVEGEASRTLAADYYRRAVALMEKMPFLYATLDEKASRIYDEYTGLLIRTGRGVQAFDLCERKYAAMRVMVIYRAVPAFRDLQDNRVYRTYHEKTRQVRGALDEISRLLEAGESRDSEKVRNENERLSNLQREIRMFIDDVMKTRPLAGSYMVLPAERPAYVPDAAVYRFFVSGEAVYGWAVTQEKKDFKQLGSIGDESLKDGIGSFINAYPGKNRLVVLDEQLLKLMERKELYPVLDRFILIPSLERARFFKGGKETAISSIFYSGKGLRQRLEAFGIYGSLMIAEGPGQEENLRLYDLLVDDTDGDAAVKLFSGAMRPVVLIRENKTGSMGDLRMFMEAGIYAGVKSLVLYRGLDTAGVAGIIRGLTDETAVKESLPADAKVMRIGYTGRIVPVRSGMEAGAVKKAYTAFDAAFREGNLAEASILLGKWKELAGPVPENEARYWLRKAELECAAGRKGPAREMAEKARSLAAGHQTDIYAAALSMKLYLLLSAGEFTSFHEFFGKEGNVLSGTMDGEIYRTVAAVAKGETEKSLSSENDTLKPLINPDLLRLLLADFYSLAGMKDKERLTIKGLSFAYPLPERELCRAVAAGAVPPGRFRTARTDGLAGLRDERADVETIIKLSMQLAEKRGRYDNVSPLPVLAALDVVIKKTRYDQVETLLSLFDIDQIRKNGEWIDTVSLSLLMEAIYSAEGKSGDALNTIAMALADLGDRSIPLLRKHFLFRQGTINASLDRYYDAYDMARSGAGFLAPSDRSLRIRYGLLLAECEISLGRFDEAAGRMDLLEKGGVGDEFLYALYLLRARLEIAKVLKRKQATEQEWRHIERIIRGGLEVLDRSSDSLERYNRLDLVFQSIDFLISYKMSRGDYLGALVYAEVKKQLSLRSAFPDIHRAIEIPAGARKEFKSLKDRLTGGERFVHLLTAYPCLQINSLVEMVPVGRFQKKVPDNAVVLYMVRNGNDVLAWVITRQFIEPLRLKDAYRRAAQAALAYRNALASFRNTVAVSRELYSIFAPLERFYRGKKTVLMCVDGPLEKIPFEIMGTRSMLEESHVLVYLSSIISSLRDYGTGEVRVSLLESDDNRVYGDLEVMALRQMGVPLTKANTVRKDLGHILPSLFYDPMNRRLLVNNLPFNETIKGATALYFSSIGFTGPLGYNDISLYGSLMGVRGAVFNDADIHDINGALFVDGYYKTLKNKQSMIAACGSGKSKVREKKRFSSPAYWAGIRLFINGL